MGRTVNIGLAVALLVSVGLSWIARGPRLVPAYEYFPNMVRTARYNAFEPNPNFADRLTLRSPVPGTIPRGLPPLPRPDVAASAAGALANPFTSDDRAALERGEVVFRNFCMPCHGPEALGNGTIVQRGFPQPPTLLRERTRQLTDPQIFRILTTGIGAMASYAPLVSRDDRWKVILHLRALQQRAGGDAAGQTP